MPDQTEMHLSAEPPDDPNATRLSDGASGAGTLSVPGLVEVPGFDIVGELGRGGMGVVYRARDRELTRDVAIKMLQPRYTGDTVATRRFVAEADITARLAHPSVPPVHRVGTLPDGRPYLVMKMIDGQTLDELLKARTASLADLPRHLDIFEHVCLAVAFAHARGIIHRDLKPHNVMVGAFGEVQVMDWGLAKQVSGGQRTVDSEDAEPLAASQEQASNAPSDSEGSTDMTLAGTVLGTPAYMAPEQARGETVGTASDVFGLGALLCCVLIGEAPFGTSSSDTARLMSIRGELLPAFTRLDTLAGEADLVALCKRCLDPNPKLRPTDAGEVAKALAAVRAAAEERAERAEQERTRAETRAAELRKRRQVWALLTASVLVLVAGVVATLWWADHRDAESRREREVDAARDREGITAALDAAEVALHAGHLVDADAALQLAQKRLTEHPDADPDNRFASLVRDRDTLRELERALDRAWTDSKKGFGAFDPETLALYPAAFSRYGLKVGEDPPERIVAAVRKSRIDDELTTGLREWFILDHNRAGLREVLNQLDPDAERVAIRAAVAADDHVRIRELADRADPTRLAPGIAVLLGMNPAVPTERAVALMAGAWSANPGNFPLALRISFRLESLRQTRLAEAVGWCRVAVALRPRSAAAHKLLANALFDSKEHDDALHEYRLAIDINPNLPLAHFRVGSILAAKGDRTAALTSLRNAVRLDPASWEAHDFLGDVLTATGDYAGALAAYRDVARLRPTHPPAHAKYATAVVRAAANSIHVAAHGP